MAALSDRHPEPVVDLRNVSVEHLEAVLEEETGSWRSGFDWDFQLSANLVRRFVQMRALGGFALMRGPRIVGYSYYVCEEGKGLVGDLYLLEKYRTVENENVLLDAVLNALWRTTGVQRVEGQLMMLTAPLKRVVPHAECFRSYPRYFMELPLDTVLSLPVRELAHLDLTPWQESRQDETARLIAAAYQGHIDSQINDQYRSPAGARRFLTNIVQYPGCGTFFGSASYAANDRRTGELAGVALASLVASDVGHVTQVCVGPAYKGTGLGYELMRRSLLSLAAHGCRAASLTVTASNESAIRLYREMGFIHRRDFAAYVWEPR